MTLLESWVGTPLAGALGWTLLHSLWQGAILAAALGIVLMAARSARVRYGAACSAMLVMLSAFVFTLARTMPERVHELQAGQRPPFPAWNLPTASDTSKPSSAAAAVPWLAPFWIAGVWLFYLGQAASWISVLRMRRRGVCCAPERWQREIERLSSVLRLSRPVQLLESCVADAPVVLGHFRPLILMPVGLLTGLPAGQVEAILLHELAHICRCDYLVNVFQRTIEGLLFYPIGYQPGTRYPLVVQMHGGPFESDKFGAGAGVLQNYVPVLTAKGYAVLRPNYRGSAGYGNAFYRGVVGHYFQDMPYDILNGVDALIQRGIVNPDQMVLMGWSAGGHLANKLITMTGRFKASSSGASLAQWISLYGQTDSRVNRNVLFGGTPWQKNAPTDLYWAESPLKDVANIKTPALFFSSDRDERIGMWQSVEMYRALVSNGVPTHLYIAPREGHQWAELRHLIFKANTELEWFEKYARGKTYTWEKTPQ